MMRRWLGEWHRLNVREDTGVVGLQGATDAQTGAWDRARLQRRPAIKCTCLGAGDAAGKRCGSRPRYGACWRFVKPGASILLPSHPHATAVAMSPVGPLLTDLKALLAEGQQTQLYAGAMLHIHAQGQTLLHYACGHAQAASVDSPSAHPEAMQPEHIFDLASVTKALATTLAAMLLVEEGALELQAPVGMYLQDFNHGDKAAMQVHHLLRHTSGFAAWRPLYYHEQQRDRLPALLAAQPLQAPVGSQRIYSDLGYITLGFVLEAAAKQRLDTLLQQRLFGPLGLKTAGFNAKARGLRPLVPTSYGNDFERQMVEDANFGYPCTEVAGTFQRYRKRILCGEVMDGNAYHCLEGVAGHAGLFGTAQDVATLGQLILGGGEYAGRRYFSEVTWQTFVAAHDLVRGEVAPFGWVARQGVGSMDYLGGDLLPPATVHAFGFTGTFAYLCADTNLAVVLLTNRTQMGRNAAGLYPNVRPLFARLVQAAEKVVPLCL
jgi:CubicO group peptidase (beta-lactamase class C family)